MPATYKVTEVVGQDAYNFPDKDNPGQQVFMVGYELKVEGPGTPEFDPVTDTIKRHVPANKDGPQPGDEIFANVETSGKGYKLASAGKRDRDRTPMDTKGSRAGYRQQDPPEVVARIGRAHAQQMAIEFITAAGGEPDLDLTNDKDVAAYLNGPVKRFTDWFAADVDKAGTDADDV